MVKNSLFVLLGLLLIPVGITNGQSRSSSDAYGAGVHHYFSGRYQEAINSFNTAIAEDSRDTRSYYFRGLAQIGSGNSSAGDSDFLVGASIEATNRNSRSKLVTRSLERVQGGLRLRIEKTRKQAFSGGGIRTGVVASSLPMEYPIATPQPQMIYPAPEPTVVVEAPYAAPIAQAQSFPIVQQPSFPIVQQSFPIVQTQSFPIVQTPTVGQTAYSAPIVSQPGLVGPPVYDTPFQQGYMIPDGIANEPIVIGEEPTIAASPTPAVEATDSTPSDNSIFNSTETSTEPATPQPDSGFQPAPANDSFGTPTKAQPAPTADAFNTQPAAEPFGTSKTTEPAKPADNMFGGADKSATEQAENVFGGTKEPAAEPSKPAGDAFGGAADTTPEPADNAFGGASEPVTEPAKPADPLGGSADPFGGASGTTEPAKPTDDPFGGASEPAKPAEDVFGGNEKATSQPAKPSSDPFGGELGGATDEAAKPAADPFGGSTGSTKPATDPLGGTPGSPEDDPFGIQ